MFEREKKIIMGEGKIVAVILLAAMTALAPVSVYGFEMKDEYYEISYQEAGALVFDGTTIKAGTTGQLVLSKPEGGWVSESPIRTTDIGIITAKVVTGDSGLNVIEYMAKAPGEAQLIVVAENGAAVNTGMFYATAAQDGDMAAVGWVQENGQWKYEMGDGTYKNNDRLADQGKRYYLGQDGVMYVGQWTQEGERWYHLGADSVMMTDTVAPSGYRMNASGIWGQRTLKDHVSEGRQYITRRRK